MQSPVTAANPLWRQATKVDLETINEIADEIHVDLPERPEVFEEKFKLFPQGCLVLVQTANVVGYGFAHPWLLRNIPPLDEFLGSLPSSPECLFIHDVAIIQHWADRFLTALEREPKPLSQLEKMPSMG